MSASIARVLCFVAACSQPSPEPMQPTFPSSVPPPDPTFDDAARGYPGACRELCTTLQHAAVQARDMCEKDPAVCADYKLYIRALQRLMVSCPHCEVEPR